MKTKLLRKCRKKIKLYKRNNDYILRKGKEDIYYKEKGFAYFLYRYYIIEMAEEIFGSRPKKRIL